MAATRIEVVSDLQHFTVTFAATKKAMKAMKAMKAVKKSNNKKNKVTVTDKGDIVRQRA